MAKQKSLFEDYDGFVEKFKPKKTTDDCYTPANIYDVVAQYVENRYGIRPEDMVRPFWPGGDYEAFDYPAGCCVVDNPPFSIITPICSYYSARKIRYFLFCPYLTAGSIVYKSPDVTIITAPVDIVYENGANVNTCFATNMEPENIIRGDPDLYNALDAANKVNLKAMKKQMPKYEYPDEILTVTKVGWFTVHNTPYALKRSDCCVIDGLDEQRLVGKSIFGNGFLLSERAAAERAAATTWQLSEREKEIVRSLG